MLEIIKMMAEIATTVTVIIAVIEAGYIWQKHKADVDHDKKKDTLEAYNRLQRESLEKLYLNYDKKRIKEIAEHHRRKENAKEFKLLGTYVARIEHFCVGVEKEIYDWQTVYELSHGFFDGKIKALIMPLLDMKRDYSDNDPYENTRKVFERMKNNSEDKKKG